MRDVPTPYAETGKRIYDLRKERGYTREKLSEMADISVQFLADIEKGRKNMTVTTLRRLAAALAVTTDYIVNGKTELSPHSDGGLTELCRTLDPQMQDRAAKLLRVFIEAVNGR